MEFKPNEEFCRIEKVVRNCAPEAAPWAGIVYRSATPRYAGVHDMVTGIGSARLGGRESISQAIGRAAWLAGLEGLIVPSRACKGNNAVLFPGNLRPGSRIRALD